MKYLFDKFKLTSLKSKIRLVFLVAFMLLVLLFGVLWSSATSHSLSEIEMQERANIHYLYLYYLKYGKIDRDYLESQNIRIVDIGGKNLHLMNELSKNNNKKFYIVNVKFHRYILINNDRFKLILENLNKPKFPFELAIAFVGAILLLLVLYIWVIRSISPLSNLKNQIIRFSEGDLNISCKSDKKDEIAEVANAFDLAVDTIRNLLQSRQLLLRAIMHELKTPIAKGRLLSEMITEPRKKERFHAIFERLNLLIDEFAKVEKITSKNFQADLRNYKMSDILEASIDMLMLDDPNKNIHIVKRKDFTVEADFELLSLALKNLIDNGIKYSKNHYVDILLNDNSITISNSADALKEPMDKLFEPFHQSRNGLGLGLYIVKSILDIHNMELRYNHHNGINSFEIVSK